MKHQPQEEPPPIAGTWGRLYAAILLYLGLLIFFFHLFTAAFNR